MTLTRTARPGAAQLMALASSLTTQLDEQLAGDLAGEARMQVLANLVGNSTTTPVGGIALTGFLETYYGAQLSPWVAKLVTLHKALVKAKLTSARQAFDLGRDCSLYALRTRKVAPAVQKNDDIGRLFASIRASAGLADTAPPPREIRMLVLTSQQTQFIFVLHREFGSWTLHIRQLWLELDAKDDAEVDFRREPLDELLAKGMPSPADLVRAVKYAERFSDQLPGEAYPSRPGLGSYLAKDAVAIACDAKAPLGLRYGDSRDKGYVLSIREASEHRPARLAYPLALPVGTLEYVLKQAEYAYEELVDTE
jgi:hypothetical protein